MKNYNCSVGNLILSTSCEFYYNDFIIVKYVYSAVFLAIF